MPPLISADYNPTMLALPHSDDCGVYGDDTMARRQSLVATPNAEALSNAALWASIAGDDEPGEQAGDDEMCVDITGDAVS